MTPAQIEANEERFYGVWPADEMQELNGWRMRFTRGVSRRANSVFPLVWSGRDLDADIGAVEAAYRMRSLRPAFVLPPVTRPEGLEERLIARGYTVDGEAAIRTAPASTVARLAVPSFEVSVHDAMPDAFRTGYLDGQPPEARAAVRTEIMARVPGPRAYVVVRERGMVLGVGTCASSGTWAAIQGMRTSPRARGRGVARAVLRAIGHWSEANGITALWLQVETNNPVATALYEKAGFTPRYTYHYRVLG